MVPTNDFLPVATSVGANVESQAAYAADATRTLGQQPGVASSAFNNKALRQAAWIAATLAQFLANTTGNNVLDDTNQAALLATMALAWPANTLPTQTILTTTGTATGYIFTCTSFNATIGATYSNNTNIYTVLATVAGGTILFCSQGAAPTATGTLTKQSGTGDSTITFSLAQAMATYTTPASCKYLEIEGVGGGGGGGGSAGAAPAVAGGSGGNGGITSFGSNMIYAFGGLGGAYSSAASALVTGFVGAGVSGLVLSGGQGMSTQFIDTPTRYLTSQGGSSAFGGSGAGGYNAGGSPGGVNTGGGGGGAGVPGVGPSGAGGNAGSYFEALIPSPAATYFYCIGSAGAGGTAGSTGYVGGPGSKGVLFIKEHYTA